MAPKKNKTGEKSMTLLCAACNKSVTDSISCNKCLRIFHPACTTLTDYRFDERLYTACLDCLGTMQKLAAKDMSNSAPCTPNHRSSPARLSILVEREKIEKIFKFMTDIDVTLKELKSDNDTNKSTLQDIQVQMSTLKTLPGKVDSISNNFDKLTKDVSELSNPYKTVENKCKTLQGEISKLRSDFTDLKNTKSHSGSADSFNRDREDTEIVISGCPKSARETTADILKILKNIAKALDLPFSDSDIFSVYRITLKKKMRPSVPVMALL